MDQLVLDVVVTFCATGAVGPLKVDASLHELGVAWGPLGPGVRISNKHNWPQLFAYGDIEFSACRCRLVRHVMIPTWRTTLVLPGARQPERPARLTYDEVIAGLDARGCSWERLRPIEGQLDLRTPAGQQLTFWDVDGLCLYKTHTGWPPHECRATPEDFPGGS